MAFWMTGLSGSGKSTLAYAVEQHLFQKGYNVVVLDGDAMRIGLCRELDFSLQGRLENVRRIAEVAKIFVNNGAICLCALISPLHEMRQEAKNIIDQECFREVFVSCSLEECVRRDPKGLYTKAKTGAINDFTGISSYYDPPSHPNCTIYTESFPLEKSVAELIAYVESQSVLLKSL